MKVPVVALVEADSEMAAVDKMRWYLRDVRKLHVEVMEGRAFESEPIDPALAMEVVIR